MFGAGSKNGYQEILKGIRIKTISYGEKTLMSEFMMDKGAELVEHAHVHEQTGYLVKGKIRLYIGAESRVMIPGDSWCVPSNQKHRADILEDSVAIEVFSPYREDYAKYVNAYDIIK